MVVLTVVNDCVHIIDVLATSIHAARPWGNSLWSMDYSSPKTFGRNGQEPWWSDATILPPIESARHLLRTNRRLWWVYNKVVLITVHATPRWSQNTEMCNFVPCSEKQLRETLGCFRKTTNVFELDYTSIAIHTTTGREWILLAFLRVEMVII